MSTYNVKDVRGLASPVTCVAITNPVEAPVANYTVIINPPTAKIASGSTATFDLMIQSKDHVPEDISLSIVGLPEGITAVFDPSRGTTDFTSKLTISVDEMMCPGVYAPTIITKNKKLQLADLKLEVDNAGSVRKSLENKIAALSSKIDDLEQTIGKIKDGQEDSSLAGFVAIVLVAVIGSFLLGAFALYVLLRNMAKISATSGTDAKLQSIIDLLKQLTESLGKQHNTNPVKNTAEHVTKEQPAEPKEGDVWYAYCTRCGLSTEHGRDYVGVFCARCGNRSG